MLKILNSQINGAFDDRVEIAYHLVRENSILLQSIPEPDKFKVAGKPDQAVQMKHSSSIGVHDPKVVCDVTENTHLIGASSEEGTKDTHTYVMKELCDSHRIHISCNLPDSLPFYREFIT
jgi:hypothetical protein